MRRLSLLAWCALSFSILCACGPDHADPKASDAGADVSPHEGQRGKGSEPDASTTDAPADGSGVVEATCDNDGLLAGFVVGACRVSAVGNPLPVGTSITVTQQPVPAGLSGDALGAVLCSIALPSGLTTLPNLSLSIALANAPPASGVLFQYVSPRLSRLVPTSEPSATAVVGLVTAPGTFGATERPPPWGLQATVGTDISSWNDQASLLRNLSSQGMGGAFYDGTHLFVCNGTRLLIYNGIPSDSGSKPAILLGQPDLSAADPLTTSSLFGATGCSGLWSDGTRLVAGNGNRILIWNAIPSKDTAPADLVLGQPDFTSNKANNGGVGARTLSAVASVDSDGTRLAVAEIFNNRVLVWNKFPTTVDQPADYVVGQPDFTTNGINAGATPVWQAWGTIFANQGMFLTGLFGPGLVHLPAITANNLASDFTAVARSYAFYQPGRIARMPNGGLAVRDNGLQRIDVLKTLPTGRASPDFALGQPDLARVVSSPISASVVSSQPGEGALGAGQVMLVPDFRRLLVFDTPPSFHFEPASRVIGQPGFTTNGQVDYRGIASSTLAGPADVAVSGAFVAVADRGNNRVLVYKKSDIAANILSTSIVIGQPDEKSYVPNLDQRSPSAARLSGPGGLALDGTHLIVADTENHRVLIWNSVPSTTGTPADLVLGQADFSGGKPNRGRGDQNGDGYSDATADGFFSPTGVSSDGTNLFVADRLNNRVLGWGTFPTSNGQAADVVIGQADFTSVQANRGGGPFTFVPSGLNLPTGVTLVGTTLWVADTENNRVVRWDNVTTTPMPGAFLGQASGAVVSNPNYDQPNLPTVGFSITPPTNSASVLRPRAVAVKNGQLFVSESDSNRIHMFDASSFASGGVLGQPTDTSANPNTNGVSGASLSTPLGIAVDSSTLWVADSANNRVLGYAAAAPPSAGAPAVVALGQPSLLTNGFNQASTASNGATSQPRGLAIANGQIYIADTNNNRILALQMPVAPGQQPSRVYGQPNATLALPNAGGMPSASSLAGPQGVFADRARIIVADTGNNRVLVYDAAATSGAATLVLGQATFATSASNAGGPSARTMQNPSAAYSDGASLWVADTGNHRVLVWITFPTSNGQPADIVIGQNSFSGLLPNQGNAAVSGSSLLFPTAVIVVHGVLYIADTGNNRVVSYSTPPTTAGASADGVLGQADLTTRTSAIVPEDLTRLAGPVSLAEDGESLYVVDRDLGRVLSYGLGAFKSGQAATVSIGITGGLVLASPQGIAAERTSFFTSRLYIGDTGRNQVAIVQSVSRLAPF